MGDLHRQALRGEFLVKPAVGLTMKFDADWFNFDEHNAVFRLVAIQPTVVAGLNQILASKGLPLYDSRWITAPFSYDGTGPNLSAGTVWGVSNTTTYEFSSAVTLKSITAFRKTRIENDQDSDGSPLNILDKLETLRQQQFSQELQLTGTSAGGRLKWVGGFYYFHESIDNPVTLKVFQDAFGLAAASFIRTYSVKNRSLAGYGQLSFGITDKLTATAGLRYTDDLKDVTASQNNLVSGVLKYPVQSGRFSSHALSPRFSLDYRVTPDVMLYASAAQGAKNGGYNGAAARPSDFVPFADEKVWTYEGGIRSTFLGGRARFNATGFYSDYRNLQLQILGSTPGSNGAPVPFSIITNIPKAHIAGAELEVQVVPVTGFRLNGGLGLTVGHYDELPNTPQFVASAQIDKNSHFSHMPKLSATIGSEYSTQISHDLTFTGRLDLNYSSKVYYNPENTAAITQPAYALLNGRLSLQSAQGLTFSVFATNLTNKKYIVGGYDDAGTPHPALGFAYVVQGAPRQWGASIQWKF